MAKVFISEHPLPRIFAGQLLPVVDMPAYAEQVVAIGGSSTQSAAFGSNTQMIRVHTDAICSISIASNPTATANTPRLAANTTEYFKVEPGHKIAVITNT
jgi:vacuolar-type H+-ATPase subunit B/Vma2